MIRKKDNLFLSRMEDYENRALESCSDSIKKLIHEFYIKCTKSKVKWDGSYVDWNIENLFEATMYFAENTTKDEIIEGEDLLCIKGIMKELEKLYDEILHSNPSDNRDYYSSKISLISEIFCKNVVGMKYEGKIFERYRDLYSIINLVNEHYDELSQKGFGLDSVWYPFWEVIKRNPMSEDEKMNVFLGLVNGTMKFHPIYEYKAIGYTIKPIDFNETLVNNTRTRYDEEMALIQNDVIFEINGEGKQQKVVRKQI